MIFILLLIIIATFHSKLFIYFGLSFKFNKKKASALSEADVVNLTHNKLNLRNKNQSRVPTFNYRFK